MEHISTCIYNSAIRGSKRDYVRIKAGELPRNREIKEDKYIYMYVYSAAREPDTHWKSQQKAKWSYSDFQYNNTLENHHQSNFFLGT